MKTLKDEDKKRFPFKEEHVEKMVRTIFKEDGVINQMFDWTTSPVGEPLTTDYLVTSMSGPEDGIPEVTLDIKTHTFTKGHHSYLVTSSSKLDEIKESMKIWGEEVLIQIVAEALRNSLGSRFIKEIQKIIELNPYYKSLFDIPFSIEETEGRSFVKSVDVSFVQNYVHAEASMYRQLTRGGVTHILSGVLMDSYWRVHQQFDWRSATQPVFIHRTGSIQGIQMWRGPKHLIEESSGYFLWKNPDIEEDKLMTLAIQTPFILSNRSNDFSSNEFFFDGDLVVFQPGYVREIKLLGLPSI